MTVESDFNEWLDSLGLRQEGDDEEPDVIVLLPLKGEPEAAPSWTEGDRCICRGEIGRVEALGPGCAAVVTDAGRWLFVAIEELREAT